MLDTFFMSFKFMCFLLSSRSRLLYSCTKESRAWIVFLPVKPIWIFIWTWWISKLDIQCTSVEVVLTFTACRCLWSPLLFTWQYQLWYLSHHPRSGFKLLFMPCSLQATFIWHENIKSDILHPFTFTPLFIGMRISRPNIVQALLGVALSQSVRPYLYIPRFNGVRISCSDICRAPLLIFTSSPISA